MAPPPLMHLADSPPDTRPLMISSLLAGHRRYRETKNMASQKTTSTAAPASSIVKEISVGIGNCSELGLRGDFEGVGIHHVHHHHRGAGGERIAGNGVHLHGPALQEQVDLARR